MTSLAVLPLSDCCCIHMVFTKSCANAFVKKEWEIKEFEPMPVRPYLDVVDPCIDCRRSVFKSDGCKPWEQCMRQRRQCLRRGKRHPFPVIRRVAMADMQNWIYSSRGQRCTKWRIAELFGVLSTDTNRRGISSVWPRVRALQLDEDRDFACVFQIDGSDTITWDKQTRCRVPCDKCWSLEQCMRMKHTLDPRDIAFLDMDDAPGVTPAKRSCKNNSPSGSTKTPGSRDRGPKQARPNPRSSPSTVARATGGSPSSAPPATPTAVPRLAWRPAAEVVAATGLGAGTRSSPPQSSLRSNGNRGGRGGSPLAETRAGGKGKGPARGPSVGGGGGSGNGGGGGGGGDDSRAPSPDTAAGTGARTGARVYQLTSKRENEISIEKLREQVQEAAVKVQKTTELLRDIDLVQQDARAQIRDAESLLNFSKRHEKQILDKLALFKSEEAEAKDQLKNLLKAEAEKRKAEAALLEQEAQLLP